MRLSTQAGVALHGSDQHHELRTTFRRIYMYNTTQVSDGEGYTTGPESPSTSPRLSKTLVLNTTLGQAASYRYTPKGEIWLSGFQSPIPQSGLMSATCRAKKVEMGNALRFATSTAGSDGNGSHDGSGVTSAVPKDERGLAEMKGGSTAAAAIGGVVRTPMIERLVLLGRVGEGETGVVYRAFDLFDLALVAVKVIPVNDQKKRRQLVHEVSSLHDRLGMRGYRRRATADEFNETDLEASREVRHGSWPTEAARKDDPHAGSEHILELIDVFVTKSNSTVSLVVEYMDGGSLQVQQLNKNIHVEEVPR